MSKKRKTKKEKMVAAKRRDFQGALTVPTIQEITSSILEDKPKVSENTYRPVHNYSYVAIDVRKTLFITSILILLNLALFFVLRLRIINIPGLAF